METDAGKKERAVSHVENTKEELQQLQDAQAAAKAEHDICLKDALRENWKACMWSAIISLTIVMEGYDLSLIQNFFAYPSFRQQFGVYLEAEDDYELTSQWQVALANGTTAGVIIGGFINGWASARFGYRKTLQVALVLMSGFIFISFFAVRIEMLLVGQMLCGLTWGVFATTGPAYASEVCPLSLRGYLTVYVNLCWAMGQFIAAGVLHGNLSDESQWGWRLPIAIQWIWPVPIITLIHFAPDSPWWLARKEKYDEAERALGKLSNRTAEECRGSLAQIIHTLRIESEERKNTSYWDCFKGVNLRRTEVCMVVFAGQQLSGATFAYTPTYFFLQAGIGTDNAYVVAIASTAMAFIGTVMSWFLLTRFGRRSLYTCGMAAAAASLLIIGTCSAASDTGGSMWAQVSFVLVWKLIYSLTIGPICYAIISETSAVRLRPQTVVIARNTYNVTQILAGILNPYMLNPTAWDWQGKAGFFWFGAATLTAIWAYFRLPETRDRSYEELDLLFSAKVSARKFKSTHVDAYNDGEKVAA